MHPSAKIKSNTNDICSIKPAWISCHGFNYISAESGFKYSLLFVSRLSVSHFPDPPPKIRLCLPRRVSTWLSLDFTGALDLLPSRALIPLCGVWQMVFSHPPPCTAALIESCVGVRFGMDAAHLHISPGQLLAQLKVLEAPRGSEHMNRESTPVHGIVNNLVSWCPPMTMTWI